MSEWMNEYEIDDAVRILADTPLEPYARYLAAWRDFVNSNSDGWPYWSGGSKPASSLMEVLSTAVNAAYRNRDAGAAMQPYRAATAGFSAPVPPARPPPPADLP